MNKKTSFFLMLFLILTAKPSYAYLDPGTGSIVVQFFLAVFALAAAFFNKIKAKVKYLFTKKRDDNDE